METIIAIKRLSYSALEITLSNKQNFILTAKRLRAECPCAECRAKQNSREKVFDQTKEHKKKSLCIIQRSDQERLKIERIWPVGNYAIGILWGDGHKTGIYKFDFLLNLRE